MSSGGGALTQLVALGAANRYLTGGGYTGETLFGEDTRNVYEGAKDYCATDLCSAVVAKTRGLHLCEEACASAAFKTERARNNCNAACQIRNVF